MTGTHNETTLTAANIGAIRDELRKIAPDQADALEAGCRTWIFTNPEGFSGRITIWPDGTRAAIASAAGSHWGRWDAERRKLLLDDGDVYSAEGAVGEDA